MRFVVALAFVLLSTTGCKRGEEKKDENKETPNIGAMIPKGTNGTAPAGAVVFVKLTSKELFLGDTLVAPFTPGPDHGFAKEQKTRFTINGLQKAIAAHPPRGAAIVLAEKNTPHQAVFEVVTTLLEANVNDVRLGVSPDGTAVRGIPVTSLKGAPAVSLVVDKSETRVVSALYSTQTFPASSCLAKNVLGLADCINKLDTKPRDGDIVSISARADTEYATVVTMLDGAQPSFTKQKLAYVCCVETK